MWDIRFIGFYAVHPGHKLAGAIVDAFPKQRISLSKLCFSPWTPKVRTAVRPTFIFVQIVQIPVNEQDYGTLSFNLGIDSMGSHCDH
jgi:hypothetical protein